MTRISISVPEDLARALAREARRRRESVSSVAREALRAHLGGKKKRRLSIVALGASGHRHTARDVDAILDRDWVDDRDR